MKWVTHLAIAAALVVGCGRDADPAPPGTLVTANGDPKQTSASTTTGPQVIFESESGPISVALEVVATPELIQRGLMHRRSLSPNRGMLFVFSSERVRSFWMKNTLIPLDMFFVKEDMTIAGIERNTVPLTLDSRTIGIPTRYVIEVNGGWAAKHGVEPGSQITLKNLPDTSSAPL